MGFQPVVLVVVVTYITLLILWGVYQGRNVRTAAGCVSGIITAWALLAWRTGKNPQGYIQPHYCILLLFLCRRPVSWRRKNTAHPVWTEACNWRSYYCSSDNTLFSLRGIQLVFRIPRGTASAECKVHGNK